MENPSVTPTDIPEQTPATAPTQPRTEPDLLTTTPTETPTKAASTPEPPPKEEYQYIQSDNIKVAIDKNELPVYYVFEDGTKVNFDKEKVKKIKEKAISSKEPEIITMIAVEDTGQSSKSKYEPSREHPKVSELPKDVLSEKELEERGIKIIQPDNTTLYIREGAFAVGSQLADFNRSSDRKLTIVLVNGPFLSKGFMEDDRYIGVREQLSTIIDPHIQEQTPSSYKKETMKYLEEKLSGYSKAAEEIGNMAGYPDSWMKRYKGEIYALKRDIYILKNVLNNRQLSDQQLLLPKGGSVLGEYEEGDYYMRLEKQLRHKIVQHELDSVSKETLIFIAVGKTPVLNGVVFAFDEKGQLMVENTNLIVPNVDIGLDSIDTHPNPIETKIRRDSGQGQVGYLYGVDSVGHLLRHEVAHDELIAQKLDKGEIPNWSEYDTDIQYMRGIRDAWEKWEKSGFTDNRGYYFVFSLPPEEGGGYILTERPSSAPTPRSKL